MVDRHYPDTIEDGERLLTNARGDMTPEARAVFDTALARCENRGTTGADEE
jgi:hypothetical protein